MKKLLLGTMALAASVSMTSMAKATPTPLTGNFTITIWQGNGGGSSTTANQQADLSNPLFTKTPLVTVTYDGALNFSEPMGGTNTLAAFLDSGGGTVTPDPFPHERNVLSTSTFAKSTLFSITGSTPEALTGFVTHDDGASLYYGTGKAVAFNSSAPTSVTDSSYTLPGGSFQLVYVEANGLPARLTFDVTSVPEPASLALLGAGLVGLGFVTRRKGGSGDPA